eukprot:TRINITY_DN36756_c0_g1_i1.p3 TRINITY_DN36756_c0_g1~~TRINITY_DN36756_c0_g1_i1.p3  ORF type:complete len:112 (-),score=20.05 TRINITY_DN36756_c0_g1_i1:40-375(-)
MGLTPSWKTIEESNLPILFKASVIIPKKEGRKEKIIIKKAARIVPFIASQECFIEQKLPETSCPTVKVAIYIIIKEIIVEGVIPLNKFNVSNGIFFAAKEKSQHNLSLIHI